jgi:hypothetical protein
VHPAYTLGGCQPEIRYQEVEIDPEIAGGFDPAARRRVAKSLYTVLQPVHNPILALVGVLRKMRHARH